MLSIEGERIVADISDSDIAELPDPELPAGQAGPDASRVHQATTPPAESHTNGRSVRGGAVRLATPQIEGMWMACWIAGGLLVGLTLLPLVRTGTWWVRLWDYPRLQLATGLAAVVAVEVALVVTAGAGAGEWALLSATAAALLWQAAQILPYTPVYPVQSLDAAAVTPGLRLLIANVLMHNRRADRLLALVRDSDPDLFLAIETDAWWHDALAVLARDYPHAIAEPRPNTYGIQLRSRLPLRHARIHHLVQDEIPSIETEVRLPGGRWCRLWCVHPEPPQPGNDTEERDAELVLVGRRVAADDGPTIVAGDLNDVAWSHTTRLFQRISGLLDPRVGRGMFSTYHAALPFARWPLDHIFHDDQFRLARLRRLGAFGSDHFPVLIELVHAPEGRHEQAAPEADAADHAEAAAVVAEGNAAARE